ncbi:MAG: hypothetical protein ACRCXZ_08165 [Patescibacteria group bacterium]
MKFLTLKPNSEHQAYLSIQQNTSTKGYRLMLSNHIPLPFVDSELFYPSWIEIRISGEQFRKYNFSLLNNSSYCFDTPEIYFSNAVGELVKGPGEIIFHQHAYSIPGERVELVCSEINQFQLKNVQYYLPAEIHESTELLLKVIQMGRFRDLSLNPCSIGNFWMYYDKLVQLFPEITNPIESKMIGELYGLCRIS